MTSEWGVAASPADTLECTSCSRWPFAADVDGALRRLEPLGVEQLDGVGCCCDEAFRVLVRLEVGEHVVRERAGIAAFRPPDADAQAEEVRGAEVGATERRPLCPAVPPPRRAWSRASGRSLSSWTTSTASGSSLKNRIAAFTERPESFMYVSGFRSATLCPSMRISASFPLNFPFHAPS